MSNELPQGWIEATINEINLHKSQNITPSDFPEEEFELFSVPIFPTGKPENLLGKDIGSSKQVVSPGDVLLCKINPRINRVWTVGEKANLRQIASSEWINIRNPLICANYLKYAFSKKDFRELLCSEVAGVGGSLTRAQPKKVEKYTVPIAPLNEQIRIADKLDSVLAKVDAAQVRLEKIPTLLKRFRQSVLAAAVSGKLTEEWRTENQRPIVSYLDKLNQTRIQHWENEQVKTKRKIAYKKPEQILDVFRPKIPDSWIYVSLSCITSRITYGLTIRPTYVSKGVPIISAKEIRSGSVEYESANMISSEDYEMQREKCKIYMGDVLFSKTGTIGHVAMASKNTSACSSQNIAVLTPLINSRYLEIVMRSPFIQKIAGDSVKTTAIPDLQLGTIAKFPIPLPHEEEQTEIVRRVESLFTLADTVEKQYLETKKRIDRLTQSLLAKAFRGELVPQDPDDEPAAELLKRIQAERNAQPPVKNKRKQQA